MRINWPSRKPRLQAYLGTNSGKVRSTNTSFIMANTPPDHWIYFVAGSAHVFEHENLKQDLGTFGVPFEEKIITIGDATVGLFRRRKVERKAHFVLGHTDKKSVIDAIFTCYNLAWYGEGWSFVFFVAREEPPGWKAIIDVLSVGGLYSEALITNSHCILETKFEHGISIASLEITEDELRKIATQVAGETSMYLTITTVSPASKNEKELYYCEECNSYRWFVRKNDGWYCDKRGHRLDDEHIAVDATGIALESCAPFCCEL